MKAAESKTTAASRLPQAQKASQPFFRKAGEGSFFSKEAPQPDFFFSPKTIQPKLTIGAPGDKYEQEADAMAEKVVQRLAMESPQSTVGSPAVQMKCAACEEEDKIQKMEGEEEEEMPQVQKKAIFESNEEPPKEAVQTKSDSGKTNASPENNNQQINSVSYDKIESELNRWEEANRILFTKTYWWIYRNYAQFLADTHSSLNTSFLIMLGKSIKGEFWEDRLSKLLLRDKWEERISQAIAKSANKRIAKIAVKSGASALIPTFTAFGTSIGLAPGAVVGFIIGAILDGIVSLIVELAGDNDELIARLEGASEATKLNNKLQEKFESLISTNEKEIKEKVSSEKEVNKTIRDQEAIDALADFYKMQANELNGHLQSINLSDNMDLHLELLKEWVMENSGEEDNPASGIEEEEWEFAIKKIKENEKGFSEDDDQITNHPELFAYQFRAELRRWGLKTEKADKVVNLIKELLAKGPSQPADHVLSFFDDDEEKKKGYSFGKKDIEDYELFTKRFLQIVIGTSSPDDYAIKEYLGLIKKENLTMQIFLDLSQGDGSVYVDDFLYSISLFGFLGWFLGRKINRDMSPD